MRVIEFEASATYKTLAHDDFLAGFTGNRDDPKEVLRYLQGSEGYCEEMIDWDDQLDTARFVDSIKHNS